MTPRIHQNQSQVRRQLVYLVTEDWYFVLHRLPLARAARESGFDVTILTQVSRYRDMLESEGFTVIHLDWDRRVVNPLAERAIIVKIAALYKQIQPDLIHHVAVKPIVYGGFAARRSKVSCLVHNFAGLGSVFSSHTLASALVRTLLVAVFRYLFRGKGTSVLVENPDDRDFLTSRVRLSVDDVELIRGVGVDIRRFTPTDEDLAVPIIVMVSRMLWDKGIGDLVSAARLMRQQGFQFRVALVGTPDPGSRDSVPEEQLRQWEREGVAEWWGYREQVEDVWKGASIGVLPTVYREGLPRTLLEGAASGRPLVATDMPGCREIVRDGENGFLVPPRDPAALADALGRLVRDADLRRRMGRKGRELVEQYFSEDFVVGKTLAYYQKVLECCREE
jgi:glycosyltransferase involved in cell wall biosynthesis